MCLQMCVFSILRCPKFGYLRVGYLMLIFIVLCQLDSAGYGTKACMSIIVCMQNPLADYSPQ
jgi:hypothetical protein